MGILAKTVHYLLAKLEKSSPNWHIEMNSNLDVIDAKIREAYLLASLAQGLPVGAVVAYGATVLPTGFLECNGASLLRTDYPVLFAIIGTAFGAADALHFNLPDLRGRFWRGWDHGLGRDPDRTARTASTTGGATGDAIGSVQEDALQGHWHEIIDGSGSSLITTSVGGNIYYGNVSPTPLSDAGRFKAKTIVADGVNGTPRIASETRPKNIYLMAMIKYE